MLRSQRFVVVEVLFTRIVLAVAVPTSLSHIMLGTRALVVLRTMSWSCEGASTAPPGICGKVKGWEADISLIRQPDQDE